jgi:NAD(P)-dependent dehydrogenase (short-subunit alcohol dehydrogenase family)
MATEQNDIVAVVTGGNRGIGFEIARQLGRRGARVVLTARDRKAGEAAAAKLRDEGLKVQSLPLDVTDAASAAALAQALEREFGRLDVLVNNAGIMSKADAPALEVDAEVVRELLETNTLGPLRVAQALAPLLRKSDRGRIVNMSSGMGALEGNDGGWAAYRLSKTALNGVTAVLAAELKPDRIAVNSMCPGWVRTDMGGPNATRDVAAGADTAVWLALDAPQSLTGKFVRDRKVIPW